MITLIYLEFIIIKIFNIGRKGIGGWNKDSKRWQIWKLENCKKGKGSEK